jgi:hypothetical protein
MIRKFIKTLRQTCMSSLPILLRADDFGATPGSNEGILAALKNVQVLNVGVMAVGPYLDYRLHELREHASRICLGLHASLTSEWKTFRWGPVLPPEQVPSLLMINHSFPASTQELHKRARVDEMMAEIRAQLQTLRDRQLNPGYLDTHMCFNWIEGMDEAMRELCRSEGLIYAHDPAFQSLRLPLSPEMHPNPESLQQALPETGHPVWVFHPALPDSTGALPPEVAQNRRREADYLASPENPLEILLQNSDRTPVRYDQV